MTRPARLGPSLFVQRVAARYYNPASAECTVSRAQRCSEDARRGAQCCRQCVTERRGASESEKLISNQESRPLVKDPSQVLILERKSINSLFDIEMLNGIIKMVLSW